MKIRSAVSIATLLLSAAALVACPGGNDNKQDKPFISRLRNSAQPTGPSSATTAATSATVAATAKTNGAGATGGYGKGAIKGVVSFTGKAIEMKVPKKRKEADVCKDKEVMFNAVVVNDGKLKDVFIAIADEQLEGDYSSDKPVTIDQVDCMYSPRIQGAMADQKLRIKNSDATTHNVNAALGSDVQFNKAQPKGAADIDASFEEPGIYRLKCDVHPWMRTFIVTTDNPFYSVSGADGSFNIGKVPDGKYKIVAWHARYGQKEATVEIKGGAAVEANFSYDGSEKEPAENAGELTDLF